MPVDSKQINLSKRKSTIARHFARANAYEQAAVIQQQTCQQLTTLIKKNKQTRTLEVGAGTGQMTRLLAQKVESQYWIINELAESQKETLQPLLPQAHIVIGDAETIDLGKDYSLIVAANAVQWFDYPLSFINTSYDRLTSGGQLVFNTFTPNNFKQIKTLTGRGLIYPTIEDWRHELQTVGFERVVLTPYHYEMIFESPYAVLKHIKATGVSTDTSTTAPFIWTKTALREFEKNYYQSFSTEPKASKQGVVLTYETLLISAFKP